ncbi:uroporphyrinogen decarboxylase/cobalamine-independent methonine synthase family protein [Desulforhopalus singaporensis]|uniref:Uroporphyrinogen decarboxylase (URO-D) n=1 Tax=Desulforhopalus singaporensis TaxID=91360 RepID=A0A1H0LTI6_9BACT|nr:hypothetical protein [Desulforhopalus singaporensis]SDO71415.1 hypothetical protein SAMN05660330_00846 [Desulforhopalus singaporensis]
MPIPGNLLTTAMAVMPQTSVEQALAAALSLDVPFWPQLPNYSYYEDMYVQAAEHFPGIVLDLHQKSLRFSMDKFIEEFEQTMSHLEDPSYFDVSEQYSVVYHDFLSLDLSDRPAIRGQLEGPVSFGFNIHDQDDRPILFEDTIRPFMFEFMANRINVQLARLKQKNPNAFIFVDGPGLQFIFSALSGYSELQAKNDLDAFFATVDKPRGIHLCGNPDWDFLLNLDLDILSLDIYTNAERFSSCSDSIRKFLDRGGVLVWGIVPTGYEVFARESLGFLSMKLETIWQYLGRKGIEIEQIVKQSMLSPATCCLINPDKSKTVENAFSMTSQLSEMLRKKYLLS